MKGRSVVKWLGLLLVLLGIGAYVWSGIVFANTSPSRSGTEQTVGTDQPVSVVQVAEDGFQPGIVIASIETDGPAAQAGVVRGDILLAIDDEPVDTIRELRRHLASLEVGDAVALKVLHGDDERTLTATLGERDGRPYLGVMPCGDLIREGELAIQGHLPGLEGLTDLVETPGTIIVRVVPDSPADEAGLQEGDRIVEVDGQQLKVDDDLADLVGAYNPGERVTLGIERPGEERLDVTVELGEHPDKEGRAYLGVEYRNFPYFKGFRGGILPFGEFPFDAPPLDAEPFNVPPEGELVQGAIVRHIADASPAEEAGLLKGDVVTAIDGQPIEDAEGLVDAVAEHEPGDKVVLTVFSPEDGAERQVEVTLGENPDNEDLAYLGVVIGGFLRSWRFEEEGEKPGGLGPFEEFFEGLPGNFPFDPDSWHGFQFDWQPGQLKDRFDFDFRLPPEMFEGAPCCSGDNTL